MPTMDMFMVWFYPPTWRTAYEAWVPRCQAAYEAWVPQRMREPLFGERGASLTEYAIVVGLIAVVAIVAVTGVGKEVTRIFTKIQAELAKINPAAG